MVVLVVLLFDLLLVFVLGFWLSFVGVLWLVWCLFGMDWYWLVVFFGV